MPPTKSSKRVVIDASIARAAGPEEAVFPTSKHCRDTLKTVLHVCHRLVMTDSIRSEWKLHQSRFAHTWLTQMYARRKVDYVAVAEDARARATAAACQSSEQQGDAVLKDYHLVEAALCADRIVLALDDKVRRLLGRAAAHLPELQTLLWVNPDRTEESCIDWLGAGAPFETARNLASVLAETKKASMTGD